ncbi:MAG TPA: hypothetical protein IAC62_13830 [Candidatus Pelethocola excrementipullorum]|nr:hypothetical protein [Candidatus Pelethocola excrementipullorum]
MRKRVGIITAVLLLAIIMLGVTLGAYQAGTTAQVGESTSKLGIQLIQKSGEGSGGEKLYSGEGIMYTGMPGDLVDETLRARNSGTKDLYVRITIKKSWLNKDGEKNLDADCREIEVITKDKENWIILEGDEYGEVIYCYYRKPLKPQEETTNVMEQFSILRGRLSTTGNEYRNLAVQMTFDADAIQRTAVEKAMLAEWGIIVKMDEKNGNLIGVQEQGGEEVEHEG